MRLVPLYPYGAPRAELEEAMPSNRDEDCRLCSLHKRVETVCLPAELERARGDDDRTVLAISEKPGATEDRAGRPQVGTSGLMFRAAIRRAGWKGKVVFDNSVRCAPGERETTPKAIDACRGYLAATLREVKPDRVLALGNAAFYSVLGRNPAVLSVSRGYGWLAKTQTPVFLLMNPAAAARNRFAKERFLGDLEWALTVPRRELLLSAPWDSYARVVETVEDSEEAAAELREAEWVSFDAEWAGDLYSEAFEVFRLAVAAKGGTDPWVWPKAALRDPRVSRPLRELLADRRVGKVPQNGKADELALLADPVLGWEVAGVVGDLRLWRRLLDPEAKANLQVMQELVGQGGGKDENEEALHRAMKRCRKAGLGDRDLQAIADDYGCRVEYVRGVRDMEPRAGESTLDACKKYLFAMVPEDLGTRYVATDALSQARIGELLERQLLDEDNAEIKRVWDELVGPAHAAFVQVERWGVGIDRTSLRALDQLLQHEIKRARAYFEPFEAKGLFVDANGSKEPVPFSADNQNHVRKLLFDHLRLKPGRITESGLEATSEEVLEELAKRNAAPRKVLELRQLQKKHVTYVGQILRHLAADGRLHPSFDLVGAATGRLSAHDPSVQNFPKDGELGKMLRDLFVATFDPEWWRSGVTRTETIFLELDYATLELVVLAILSGDPTMRAIFQEGRDLHLETARLIAPLFGVDPAVVDKHHPLRQKAKIVNFALAYGKRDSSLAEDLGCTVAEAAKLRAAILGSYPLMAKWLRARIKEAQRTGAVHTWWAGHRARRRPLWRIADRDDGHRINAENAAVNTPVQGTASDFGLASVAAVVRWIREENIPAKLVLTIHDSLLLEVPVEWASRVAAKVLAIMTGWETDGVPLRVDLKAGSTWGRMQDAKLVDGELFVEAAAPEDARVVRLVDVRDHFRRAA